MSFLWLLAVSSRVLDVKKRVCTVENVPESCADDLTVRVHDEHGQLLDKSNATLEESGVVKNGTLLVTVRDALCG